jgi:hypothetical protein
VRDRHDDQVDALAGAFEPLRTDGTIDIENWVA